MLDLAEESLGAEALAELTTDCPMGIEELRDSEAWISVQGCIDLSRLLAEATGDPLITYRAGRISLQSSRYLGPAFLLFRGLGTPGGVMKGLKTTGRMLNRVANWDLMKLERGHGTVAYWSDEGIPDHPLLCENRRGSLEGMPELFNLPAARIEHTTCMNRGDDRCIYDVYWIERPQGVRVLVPAAILGLTGGLVALALGESPLTSGGLIAAGGLAAGAYTRNLMRKIGQLRDWTGQYLESLQAQATANLQKADGLEALRLVDARVRLINTEEQLLEKLLDPVREGLHYDRLILLLRDADVLRVVATSGMTPDQDSLLKVFAPPYVLKENRPNTFRAIMEAGEAKLIRADRGYLEGLPERSKEVMIGTGSGAFIAAPLLQGEIPLGILLVDQGDAGAQLTTTDVQLCARLANVLALAITNARLFDTVRRRERSLADALLANQKFAHYLPRNVAEGILEDPTRALELGGEPRHAAVMFADVAGFTAWASTVSAQTVVLLLNRWFSATDKAISHHSGIVDKRMGDGLMVVFLHEDRVDHPAKRALECAQDMLEQAIQLTGFANAHGFELFGVRIGVNYGEAVAGNIGSPTRMEYTLVGDVVNLSQRLESVAPVGSVFVSKSVAENLPVGIVASRGTRALKGKVEPVEVFEPI
jgi:class 3 adenylate cyclase